MTIQDGDCRVNVTFLLILMMFGHRPRWTVKRKFLLLPLSPYCFFDKFLNA
jgi:hypothetical protein